MRFSLKSLLLFVSVAAVLTMAAMWGYRLIYGQTGSQTSSATANVSFSSRLKLPPSATDVNFYAGFCWIETDFAISERDFLAWCNEQGWTPIAINTGTNAVFKPARTSTSANDGPHVISKGYQFSTPTGKGTYDLETGRACMEHYDC